MSRFRLNYPSVMARTVVAMGAIIVLLILPPPPHTRPDRLKAGGLIRTQAGTYLAGARHSHGWDHEIPRDQLEPFVLVRQASLAQSEDGGTRHRLIPEPIA